MPTTPAPRVTTLTHTHRLDVDMGVFPAVQYNQLMGIDELKLVEEMVVQPDTSYGERAARETNVEYNWRLEIKLAYSTNLDLTTVDPVHKFLRDRFKMHRSSRVELAEFGVRFYNRDGLDDGMSHEGRVYVKSWAFPGGRGRQAVDIVLQGQGELADIANPMADMTPTVTGLSPSTGPAAGGELVNIFGTHLLGATAVDFGATSAQDFTVVSDSHIVAIAPAGNGTVSVRVTTPNGQSADTAADDFTYA